MSLKNKSWIDLSSIFSLSQDFPDCMLCYVTLFSCLLERGGGQEVAVKPPEDPYKLYS